MLYTAKDCQNLSERINSCYFYCRKIPEHGGRLFGTIQQNKCKTELLISANSSRQSRLRHSRDTNFNCHARCFLRLRTKLSICQMKVIKLKMGFYCG